MLPNGTKNAVKEYRWSRGANVKHFISISPRGIAV